MLSPASSGRPVHASIHAARLCGHPADAPVHAAMHVPTHMLAGEQGHQGCMRRGRRPWPWPWQLQRRHRPRPVTILVSVWRLRRPASLCRAARSGAASPSLPLSLHAGGAAGHSSTYTRRQWQWKWRHTQPHTVARCATAQRPTRTAAISGQRQRSGASWSGAQPTTVAAAVTARMAWPGDIAAPVSAARTTVRAAAVHAAPAGRLGLAATLRAAGRAACPSSRAGSRARARAGTGAHPGA